MEMRRIKAGPERLGLAMNILMGFSAINAGAGNEYLLGDDVGKAQYELDQETKRALPYERRLRELSRLVSEHEQRQKSKAHTYSPDTVVSAGSLKEWPTAGVLFRAIAATHSHQLLLGEDGVLYAWAWGTVCRGPHRNAMKLCPRGDPIAQLSASM